MKKIILLLFASIFCLTFTGNAQVKVGDNPTSIDARSLLELESTTKAFYLPRLSTAQAAAQTGWKAGMVIYNTTQNCVQYYDGTAWFCFTAFISVDNDKDSTNEYNTSFGLNAGGDSLIITDQGTRYAVSAGDIMDTASLSNRINTNMQAIVDSSTNIRSDLADTSAIIRNLIAMREAMIRSALVDSAAAIRTTLDAHILADEDTDSTNEIQLLSISNDTLYLSDGNNVYLGAISSDNDQDSTNEYNTAFEMNAGGDSLIITDAGTRYAVSAGDILDTTSLSNRINTNTQANIDSSAVLRTFIAVREAAIRSALVDTAAAIRTTLDAHILADEDLDSMNELQLLSISNDTLYLSDGNSVYLGAISSDNDQDSTNEYNTAFEMNAGGDSLIITDAGTRYAVSAGDVLDTTSLSNRINTNTQANIDSSGVLRTFIAVKEAAIRSALVDTAAAIRTTLDAHITADEDLDSLNERISSVTFTQDTLTIIENDSTFKIYIEDTDTTNELIDSVTFINDTISIYEGDSTFTVVIKHIPTYLCKVESGIKISYKLKEVDNIYINEIDTSLKFTHQQLIDSGYTTCASGGSSFELTDCKRREIMSDNSSVIVYFNDSADVYSTAGVRTSYASYSTWLSGSGLTVTTVLNCFDERCLQIGNVQYKDNNGDNMYANIDNSADVRSYSTLIGQSAVACTPINCQQVYGPSDFGLNGSGLPANNPACTDLSATWFDGSTGELFSWDVTGVTWVKQPSVNSVSCPQASIAASGTINSSIGVTSVSKTGTGRYKVNLAVPQSNTNYVILLSKEEGLSTRDDVNIDVIEGSKSTNSFEVLISEGDNGTTANVYRDRNWYFNIPCSENFSTGIDSISVANDTLKISEGDTTFNITLIDQDTTNEKIDTMFILGDSIAIVEGSDTFFVDCSDKDWKLNKTGSASGLQGIPGGSAASGDYSIAGGLGNAASGYSSISLGGSANSASEIASVNIGGSSNTVSGRQALNISGSGNTVSGFWGSNIGGIGNTTLGDYASILGGTNNTAYSYGETVLGFNVKSYTPGSAIAIDTTDRLFVIGNGASSSARSNALTLLKDGRLGLGVDGNSAQTATLHIKPSTSINPLRVEDLQDSIASTNKIIMAAADGTIYTAPIDSIFTPGIGTINSVLTTTTQAISGQTLDTADALQFNYLSGRKYRFKVYIVYRSSNTNNGIRLAMNPISGNVWYKMNTPVNANGSNDLFSGFNSTITHVGGGSPSTIRDLVTTLEGTIHTTSSGTFSFQFAAETGGGTITIQANSLLEFELID